ncbi:glycosyl hydrolase family 18 protein [Roseburia sp. MSJ-14]|uniref:glycosyl hydrolase family 18 protein n=1 Tax=Roseburia sp. MSJ-14 TaxID=2841514 RepID=UPI001C11FE62|nr:glycosyl hydrolase family 18 protein [Roseburia sp. MSJ-14]MBU5473527.1 LysM peptidoglycan-binding domain-containing protein [Roseburia sp. MSJ-14]
MVIYTVRSGDTIDNIAIRYQVSAEDIAYANQIPYPYALAVGSSLLLPDASYTLTEEDILIVSTNRFAYSGGYAYPFISPWVLEQTLPYLSDLFIFSYGFTTEGTLIPPALDDTFMITLAKNYGVAPILTLTPFGPNGQFSNYLITRVINNEESKAQLISSLVSEVTEREFEGVDIDFEYILSEDRIAFARFVSEVRTAINELGYPVSVALAPKTSDTQVGLLYEGKDYALLGEAADYVLLMTYEWGYTYGPAMAVAPLNKVREVVEYALTKIPAEKINLGIPNYGYDWTLPYVKGTSKARTIGNIEAVQLAISQGVSIQFDEVAQSPFFTYVQNGLTHEVWFEDARSIYGKFGLVQEYSLRGMSYWQIMRLFRANLLLQEEFFSHNLSNL